MIRPLNLAFAKRTVPLSLLVFVMLVLVTRSVVAQADYQITEWTDLMPPLDLAALENQVIDHEQTPDGSGAGVWESEDLIGSEIDSWGNPQDDSAQDAYENALVSTRTVDELNGKNIKLPGFIVPLEFDDDQTITQFFLVPYFGACIHLPPPPPNQMVLVDYPEGLQMEALYTPFWISGKLSIQIVENEVGISAYAMEMDSLEVYEY